MPPFSSPFLFLFFLDFLDFLLLFLFSIFLFREIRGEGASKRRAAARVGWMKCLAARSSPWLARPTEQGEPPWLTPGSPSPLKAAGAWPEPTAQECTI
jgi:hypothetical protein